MTKYFFYCKNFRKDIRFQMIIAPASQGKDKFILYSYFFVEIANIIWYNKICSAKPILPLQSDRLCDKGIQRAVKKFCLKAATLPHTSVNKQIYRRSVCGIAVSQNIRR